MINLKEINEANFNDVIQLKAQISDESYLDSVVYSLAEAWVDKGSYMPFAIYHDTTPVGFVSLYHKDSKCEIINFFIDSRYQGKGFGIRGDHSAIEYLRLNFNTDVVSLPVAINHHDAISFWNHVGFKKSDSIENGYIFMRKSLR